MTTLSYAIFGTAIVIVAGIYAANYLNLWDKFKDDGQPSTDEAPPASIDNSIYPRDPQT